jgi:hypothetical protein
MSKKRKSKNIYPWPLSSLPSDFLSDKSRIFIAKRLKDLFGLLLIICGLWGALSILSYDTMDPAWNVASNDTIKNWMGESGAAFADIIIQTIGYAIWGGILTICIMGYRVLKRKETIFPISVRLISLFVGLFILSASLSRFESNNDVTGTLYLGGLIGTTIYNFIGGYIPTISYVTIPTLFLIGLIFCTISIGYHFESWKKGMQRITALFYKFKAAIGWISHYDAMDNQVSKSNKISKPRFIITEEEPIKWSDGWHL